MGESPFEKLSAAQPVTKLSVFYANRSLCQ